MNMTGYKSLGGISPNLQQWCIWRQKWTDCIWCEKVEVKLKLSKPVVVEKCRCICFSGSGSSSVLFSFVFEIVKYLITLHILFWNFEICDVCRPLSLFTASRDTGHAVTDRVFLLPLTSRTDVLIIRSLLVLQMHHFLVNYLLW